MYAVGTLIGRGAFLGTSLPVNPAHPAASDSSKGFTEQCQRMFPGHVEVARESSCLTITQRQCATALDCSFGEHLADHDHCHGDSSPQCEFRTSPDVTDPLFQGAYAGRGAGVGHDFSSFLTSRSSRVVSSPSSWASRAAFSRRGVSMDPRQVRIASAAGCESRP